jgi:hypothetical protein
VTLLELVIALAISGFAILGGVVLLDQLTDSGKRITEDSMRDATAGNGDRLLRRFLIDGQATTDTALRFRGNEHTASYLSLCDTPSGWSERCRVMLSIDSLPDTSAVIAETDRGERFEVRRVFGVARFRYLDLAAQRDSLWVREWATSIAPPRAIALVVNVDTVVFAFGSVHE